VSGQKTFLFLAGKGPHKQFAGVAEPYHKNLDHELLTVQDHIGFAPVYLGTLPRLKFQEQVDLCPTFGFA